jgi:hypothetical protein
MKRQSKIYKQKRKGKRRGGKGGRNANDVEKKRTERSTGKGDVVS